MNDVSFNLPLDLQKSGVWVWQHGINVLLTTEFGLEVIYDPAFQTIVKITSSFYGQVCGLCGNYNGNNTDDYPHPDGTLAIDEAEFGVAWKDGSLGRTCENLCLGVLCPKCEKSTLYEDKNLCGLLLAEDGLFGACHGHVDPKGYFDMCVLSLCQEKGDLRALCNSLQSYVAVCQNVGITKINWRNESLCREFGIVLNGNGQSIVLHLIFFPPKIMVFHSPGAKTVFDALANN